MSDVDIVALSGIRDPSMGCQGQAPVLGKLGVSRTVQWSVRDSSMAC